MRTSRFATLALAAATLVAVALGHASAQDAQGNDTPGEWIVEHYEEYGIWKTICDERTLDNKLEQRCYIRYVDVFSPRPKFAAVFAFVFQKQGKTAFQYAFERGTTYRPDGLRIEKDGAITWRASATCRIGPNCLIEDAGEVDTVLSAFSAGGSLVQEFTDRHGTDQVLGIA